MDSVHLPQERYEIILAEVRRRRSVRVSELAAQLGVSGMTVRRDIGHLADRGLLSRVHGGAAVHAAQRTAATSTPEEIVIGMVVPSTSFYFPDMIRGAQSGVTAVGGRMVLQVSRYDLAEQWRQAAELVSIGAQGLLLTPTADPALSERVRDLGVPCVLVERQVTGLAVADVESVSSDHAAGAAKAVQHLADLGHRSVGLLAVQTPTAGPVAAGHAEAVAALGLAEAPVSVVSRDTDRAEAARAVLAECLETGTTAMLVHGDQEAALLVQQVKASGRSVPRDFAVISYDDEIAALADPPLTAVSPPKAHLGRFAAELLLNRLRNTTAPVQHVHMVPRLIVRSTCGG